MPVPVSLPAAAPKINKNIEDLCLICCSLLHKWDLGRGMESSWGKSLVGINAGMKSLAQRCPDCTWIKAGPSVTRPHLVWLEQM